MQVTDTPVVDVGRMHLTLKQVQLPRGLVIDEAVLDFEGIHAVAPGREGAPPTATVNESHVRVMFSEPNVNGLLSANADQIPFHDVAVVILTGKIRIHATYVKSILRLPFVVECVPRIENGVNIHLEFKDAHMGVSMPTFILDAISHGLKPIDLNVLPVPVFIESIECEPGRITATGRARLSWPLNGLMSAATPFTQKTLLPLNESAHTGTST